MSKSNNPKKKVVVTTRKSPAQSQPSSRRTTSSSTPGAEGVELMFSKTNYLMIIAGAVLILIGTFLMTGGSMPSPDVWEPGRIYSARITVIAPIIILIGLIVEIFAIFKSKA